MTRAVVKAGKPLVYVNRLPGKLPKGVVYCGSNSIDAGIMNMEELGKAMNGKGNLVILMGELSNEAAIGRTDGIKKIVKEKFPDIKIVREQTGPGLVRGNRGLASATNLMPSRLRSSGHVPFGWWNRDRGRNDRWGTHHRCTQQYSRSDECVGLLAADNQGLHHCWRSHSRPAQAAR